MKFYVKSEADRATAIKALQATMIGDFGFHVHINTGARTAKQNSAMHKYFSMLADDLNAAGLDMRKTLKPSVEIPWSQETVKEHLWRPIQSAVMGDESTTKLNRRQVSEVYEVLARHLSEKHGVTTAFPERCAA